MLVRSTLRWSAILVSLLAVGPVAGLLVGALRGPGGARHTSPLLSLPLGTGLANAGAAFGLAAGIGLLAARFFGSRTGMTCAGLVLAWAAWATGPLDAVLAPCRSGGEVRAVLIRLSVEGVVLGALGVALAAGLFRLGKSADAKLNEHGPGPGRRSDGDAGVILLSTFAAAATGAIVVWWVAFQPLKGQVVFGGLAGAIAAAAVAHLTAPHLPPRVGGLAAFAALAILASAGPISALVFGPAASGRAAAAGTMSHLAFLTGFDWCAGAFLGVPIGLGWSSSMVEKHAPSAMTAARAPL